MRTAAWSLALLAGTAFAAPNSDGWGDAPQGYGGWGESSSSSISKETPSPSIPVYKSETSSSSVHSETPSSSSSIVHSATPSSSSTPVVSPTPYSSSVTTTSSVPVHPESYSSVSIDTTCTESKVTTSSSVSSSTPVISKYTTSSSSEVSSSSSKASSSSSPVKSATPSSSSAVSTPIKPYTPVESSSKASSGSASKPHSTWTSTKEVSATTTIYTTAYTTVSTCTETHTTSGTTTTTTFVTTGTHTSTVTSVVQVTPVPKSSTEVWATTGTSVWAQGSSGTGETTTIATTTSTSTLYSTLTLTVPKPTGTAPSKDTTITLTTTSLTTICPATCGASSAPMTTVTKVTSVYTTICPVTETEVSGSATLTNTYESTSKVTTTYESTITLTTTAVTYGTNTWSLTVPVPATTSGPAGYPVASHSHSHGHGHGHHSKHSSKFSALLSSASKAPHSSASKVPVSSVSKLPHKSSSTSAKPTPTPYIPKPYGDKCIPCEGQPGSDPNKFCGFTVHDNSYENTPITCVHRTYDFTLSNITVSPDGVERYGLVVNGQIPGPKVEANWGDWISITVHNKLQNNGSTIHMHGLRQYYNSEADGVPSITQCPIAPGDSYTYTFRADNYGSSWYHSHFSLQTYEGVFGPVVIHGPTSAEYDIEQSIVLSDWNHTPVDQMFDAAQNVGPPPANGPRTLDTGLINGLNVWGVDGLPTQTGKRFVMNVKANKRYLLRVVSSSIQATWKFSIDGHKFKVIANDFVPIVPYETEVVSINIGQRYDLIFETNQLPGSYWMRSVNQQTCSTITQGEVKAIVRYEGAPDILPLSVGYVTLDDCLDEPAASLVPVVAIDVGAAGETFNERVFINPYNNSVVQNVYRWTLSDAFFQTEWGTPSLGGILSDGDVPYTGNLVLEAPELDEWVYIIIDSLLPVPHPIHLHGHDFHILAQGPGLYDSSVALNLVNPPRRDVAMMSGHLVIAYKTDNPGVWLLHCHIGWHNAMGFALQIVENLENIAGTIQHPKAFDETCKNWNAYAAKDDIKVIDAGV